jgi:Flp pilus assembly pilin Flp
MGKGMKSMKRLLTFLKDERGASAVEYGLLVALVSPSGMVKTPRLEAKRK